MTARINPVVLDSKGVGFDPAALPHAYTYDVNGNMLTDTCIDGATTRVKTYTYEQVASVWKVATVSAWVATTV
ncbi:hypothetical protein [Burkholderia anthina]|uniref:hypothetical protein n=1 Tax=Burkholderia anthina TaxID=179879 RepID=UPI00158E2A6B|nr:hypothetical protein [Burkholderia anthina]